jgi:hypothetical protein
MGCRTMIDVVVLNLTHAWYSTYDDDDGDDAVLVSPTIDMQNAPEPPFLVAAVM